MAAPISLANWDLSYSWKVIRQACHGVASIVEGRSYLDIVAALYQGDGRRQTSNSSTDDSNVQLLMASFWGEVIGRKGFVIFGAKSTIYQPPGGLIWWRWMLILQS